MPKVTPGKYLLIARSGEMSGRIAVEVQDADLDNVVIPVACGFDVTVHLTIDGWNAAKSATDLAKLRIRLRTDPFIPGLGEASEMPGPDGSCR
jgi:hypothetical protein